jgi:predicted nucleotidyltransferase
MEDGMRGSEAIAALRRNADTIRSFGATHLYLFGSTAREQAGDESDVDLFIDYDEDRFSFVELIRLNDYLSDLLARPTDLSTREGLHPAIREIVEAEAVRVF